MPPTDEPPPSESLAPNPYLTPSSLHQMESFRVTHKTQVLTILFTDLVGSTDLQSKLGNTRAAEVAQQHKTLIRDVLRRLDGQEVETAGDSFLVVFAVPSESVKFALRMQASMRKARETMPELPGIRVGIHQGQVVVEQHETGAKAMDIYGLQVSTAARIMGLANGGQILCSRAIFDDARAILRGDDFAGLGPVAWQNHGPYKFKGVEDSYDVCEVGEEDIAPLSAPSAGEKAWPSGRGEEELGWRPAAGVVVPGTKWTLEERLGKQQEESGTKFRGEFGEVWKAWNPDLKSREVFKFCFKRDRVSALKREARLLKQLQKHRHPNLVEVSGVTVGDRPPYYLQMEYVDGPSLEDWLATNPPLKERLEIVSQVADALDTVHAAGIYHRDIKPSNILLTHREDGALQAKLTDFGLGAAEDKQLLQSVAMSRVEPVAGTWDFIAPELRAGAKASSQSDIYSLGLTLFQLVTGNLKSQAGPGWECQVDSEILRGDIAKCMDPNPKNRWAQAGELARSLRSHEERLDRLRHDRQEQIRRARARRVRRVVLASVAMILGSIILWQIQQKRLAEQEITSARKAEEAARKAEAAAHAAASDTDYAIATLKLGNGDTPVGLAYLADALRQNPANEKAMARVVSLLRVQPIMLVEMRHNAPINSASSSPDGNWVLTTSNDKAARVWDAQTGKIIGEPMRHDGNVRMARFSPDSKWVVTASDDKTARIWDARTGRPAREPIRHKAGVNSASFSPDGNWMVTASCDETARVWDAATGNPVSEPMKHGSSVNDAEFSPDSKWVVTASGDTTARVWDARTGKPLGEPMRHADAVWFAMFSPDSKRILTTWSISDKILSRPLSECQVWDVQTGKTLGEPMWYGSDIKSASFSPDGKWVVTTAVESTAKVWDAQTGKALSEPMAVAESAEFSPDSKWVVTASKDKTARVWDARTGKPLGEPMRHSAEVLSARFNPDGKRVVTVSSDTARVWYAQSLKLTAEPMRHDGNVRMARFSPDSKWVVTASNDRTARIWDVRTGKAVGGPMQHGDLVTCANFSPDGKWVVTASEDKTARIWNARTGEPVCEPMRHGNWVISANFSPDGKWVVTASWDETARVWDARTGKAIGEPMRHDGQVTCANFSPDGNWVVTASFDKTARVWDAQTCKPVSAPMQHAEIVGSAKFSPDGKRVVTALAYWIMRPDERRNFFAQVWDARTAKPLGEPMQHDGSIWSVDFSPDGNLVVTASLDKTAKIWDAHTGKAIGGPMRHDGMALWASFSPNSKWVATACDDGTARVWNARTGEPVSEPMRHDGQVSQVDFSPDGKWVVTASADHTARIWDAVITSQQTPQWLAGLAEGVGQLQLNAQSGLVATVNSPLSFREEMGRQDGNDDLSRFGRWYVANPALRPIGPLSSITVPEFVAQCLQANTAAAVEDAQELDPSNPLVLASLAGFAKDKDSAMFYCRLALKRAKVLGFTGQNQRVQAIAAESLRNIGDLLEKTGDVKGEIECYRKSLEIVQCLADAKPEDTQAQLNLADSLFSIGWLLAQASDTKGAMENYRKSLEILQSLAQANRDNVEIQRDFAFCLGRIGRMLQKTGDTKSAMENCRKGVDIVQRLANADPNDTRTQFFLVIGLSGLGDLLQITGDTKGSVENHRKVLEFFQRRADAAPNNAQALQSLAESLSTIADVTGNPNSPNLGDVKAATESYGKSLEIRQRLADADPNNAEKQRVLAFGLSRVGDMLAQAGNIAWAMADYRKSLEIHQRQANADPSDVLAQGRLAGAITNVGDMLAKMGDIKGALESYRKSLEICQRRADMDPINTWAQQDVPEVSEKIGDMLLQTDDVKSALESYHRSLGIRQRLAEQDPANSQVQGDLADSLRKIGTAMYKAGDAKGAADSLGKALKIAEAMVKLDPNDAKARKRLADAQKSLAACQQPAGAASKPAGISSTQRASK